jgi:hypothetical protein
LLAAKVCHGCQVTHDDFGSLGFPAARFAADDDARIFAISLHRLVGCITDGEYVRRPLENFSSCLI